VVELARRDLLVDARHARQLDQTLRAAHVEAVDDRRIRAVGARHLQHHFVLVIAALEARHALAAEQGLERRADVGYRHPELGRALAVDVDLELRLVELEVGVHVDEIAELMGLGHHGARRPWQDRS
jgi:hypothetical protein